MFDLHTHTTFSDGKNTPREMVLAAIALGCPKIGFSDHGYTPFDESYCVKKEKVALYKATIRNLREEFRGQIDILLGVEKDYYSDEETDDYDYVIGSVHYVPAGDGYVPVDEAPEVLVDTARRFYGGDIYALIEAYYKNVADLAAHLHPDILGHFDLIRKFNGDGSLFDESSPRYRKAAQDALLQLLPFGIPFEINTGAISRGYLDNPYPAAEWVDFIRKHGGKTILGGDSHSAETLCYRFGDYAHLVF